ncbi:class I SAM-dependent methyltransferase [Amycolatopsis sp.]|uniref:class I SAM-dependent methyltransferase n=1 Tax=Amycolatopsis sp. TaxID=37632 RepID=UPI002C570F83|nr:class I SAM-dependent methyltransferase [Amycolatopsis sp.]HVV13260.1 class I SAM-dependent methyltransferase [Amycolatopsis sp.]
MTRLTAFLAWSTQAGSPDAVKKALSVMKNKLGEHGFDYYDWNENQSVNKDIGAKVSDELLKSDLVILEGSKQRPNLAYEVGFAHALHLPLVVIKQTGSERLPENFGEPDYLSYPADIGDENGFKTFEARFADWLGKLAATTLSPGQRSARRGRNSLNEQINKFIDGYPEEHASLHLLGGWAGALAHELDSGGASQLVVDADYYLPSFSSLRGWDGGQVRAIADLTDETEEFWTPDHPEEMTANVSERVFLIDWSWFFENEDKLARQIDLWKRHQARHRDGPYEIFIAAKEELRPGEVHPMGPSAVGHHLLLLDPDLIGGYRPNPGRIDSRQLVIERNSLRFASAAQFYDSIKSRAVRFEPNMKAADLRRAWVARNDIGHWDEDWTSETEFRSPDYFDSYERHIRCWIPRYAQMIRDSAATVFREILRIYADSMRSVDVLEIGYGTGRLTSEIVPWIRNINRPFYDLEHHGPVRQYRGVDRAEQMVEFARERLMPEQQTGLDMRLVRGTAWEDVDGRYDVVFGSLVMHFLIGPDPTDETLDEFFTNCAEHTTEDGTLIFADVFGVNGDRRGASAMEKWREWMVRYGLAEDKVEGYMAGNTDMTSAAPVSLLRKAAETHGFKTRVKVVGAPTLPFRIVVFQKDRPGKD